MRFFKKKILTCLHSACYGVIRFVMESGAKGCEVVVSGKVRAARAKAMKFADGFMIHSGNPAREFITTAVRHVDLRQGVLGIKVKIRLDNNPTGRHRPFLISSLNLPAQDFRKSTRDCLMNKKYTQ